MLTIAILSLFVYCLQVILFFIKPKEEHISSVMGVILIIAWWKIFIPISIIFIIIVFVFWVIDEE